MDIERTTPFYPVSMAAKLIGITPDRLRTYEEEGLIYPERFDGIRKPGKRLYSQNDIDWVISLRNIIKDNKISIPALKIILSLIPYWESGAKLKFKGTEILLSDFNWQKILELRNNPNYEKLFK